MGRRPGISGQTGLPAEEWRGLRCVHDEKSLVSERRFMEISG
jgi:hypothetical protein